LEATHSNLNPEIGYRFVDAKGEPHVEFHVDYCTSQQNKDNELLLGKNPRISVCVPPESMPIEVFGQDESVFSQFIFSKKFGLVRIKSVNSSRRRLGRDS
jgi:hypothetical protein